MTTLLTLTFALVSDASLRKKSTLRLNLRPLQAPASKHLKWKHESSNEFEQIFIGEHATHITTEVDCESFFRQTGDAKHLNCNSNRHVTGTFTCVFNQGKICILIYCQGLYLLISKCAWLR